MNRLEKEALKRVTIAVFDWLQVIRVIEHPDRRYNSYVTSIPSRISNRFAAEKHAQEGARQDLSA